MNLFQKLGLSAEIIEVLDNLGFDTPTPIQEQAIPLLLKKNPTDFIGLAQTGTGKTAAFGLPLIDLIDQQSTTPQALIMAPTRELGQQTAQQLVQFSKNNKQVNVEVVYGGAAISNQIKALKRPTQIVVATPGRLLDLIKRKAIRLDDIQYVVLDEADEMLNMGFKEAIDEILTYTPEGRVTWLFSATMPPDIRRIVSKFMKKPLEVAVNSEQKSNVDISHQFVVTKTANKIPALKRFMDFHPEMRGVLFCRTKRETQQIADELSSVGYGVEALHGDLSQAQRDTVMKRFKRHGLQLLIATDVAARGIDVTDLSHVMHHTLPDQTESYTHRSGRTGRAGRKGVSLAFINPRENRKISQLEKMLKVSFEKIEVPTLSELKFQRIHNWANVIINTKVDDQADGMYNDVKSKFENLSKDDLLKRLITTQLDHLMAQNESDLNETAGGSDSRDNDNGKSRSSVKSDSKFQRYFINMGAMDGVTKGDMLHLLADLGSVAREKFGSISLHKSYSFFEIEKGADAGLSERFEGVEINGRSIRVSPDNDGPRKEKPRSSGNKNKERYRKSSKKPQRRMSKRMH